MNFSIRPAAENDLAEAVELFLTTVADLRDRLNLKWPLPPSEYVRKVYGHIHRSGIFYVAEIDGKLGSICHAVVRDQLWFLSGFWTLPHLQGRKIGLPLLKRVWDEGVKAGANIFFTWSSTDLQAMAIYMKFGMMPGYQTLTFAGSPNRPLVKPNGYESEMLDPISAMQIDHKIRATRRELDHEFWRSEMKAEGRQVSRAGRVVGYYYLDGGTIGPAAWLEVEDAEPVMELACSDARERTEQLRLIAPGPNHAAIRFALKSGLKLGAYSHLLTTEPFGEMDKYLASGPSLF
ncbi:MAG: hypothetical protein QOJ64_2883 [Acidobacteriota bacterium]|jgi:GNAT superfamily N-acetyltransferase|nr:hypothetical protein [Acidobacteriota bacterium]